MSPWWREFWLALAGRYGEVLDHCGDPAPSIVGQPSTSWCIRRPGHGVPHRDRTGVEWARIDEALAGGTVPHVYLSTGCLHGEHDYCQSMIGMQGEKRPSRCKWCEAQCRCSCHVGDEGGGR